MGRNEKSVSPGQTATARPRHAPHDLRASGRLRRLRTERDRRCGPACADSLPASSPLCVLCVLCGGKCPPHPPRLPAPLRLCARTPPVFLRGLRVLRGENSLRPHQASGRRRDRCAAGDVGAPGEPGRPPGPCRPSARGRMSTLLRVLCVLSGQIGRTAPRQRGRRRYGRGCERPCKATTLLQWHARPE